MPLGISEQESLSWFSLLCYILFEYEMCCFFLDQTHESQCSPAGIYLELVCMGQCYVVLVGELAMSF